jgi:hypothetical protein
VTKNCWRRIVRNYRRSRNVVSEILWASAAVNNFRSHMNKKCIHEVQTRLLKLKNCFKISSWRTCLQYFSLRSCVMKMSQFTKFTYYMSYKRPPLWSSGLSSWLQIRRPEFDSRHYQKKKVVGLERSPLSLVSTTEELLDRKVAAPV